MQFVILKCHRILNSGADVSKLGDDVSSRANSFGQLMPRRSVAHVADVEKSKDAVLTTLIERVTSAVGWKEVQYICVYICVCICVYTCTYGYISMRY
jgi:hypothetical protein